MIGLVSKMKKAPTTNRYLGPFLCYAFLLVFKVAHASHNHS